MTQCQQPPSKSLQAYEYRQWDLVNDLNELGSTPSLEILSKSSGSLYWLYISRTLSRKAKGVNLNYDWWDHGPAIFFLTLLFKAVESQLSCFTLVKCRRFPFIPPSQPTSDLRIINLTPSSEWCICCNWWTYTNTLSPKVHSFHQSLYCPFYGLSNSRKMLV